MIFAPVRSAASASAAQTKTAHGGNKRFLLLMGLAGMLEHAQAAIAPAAEYLVNKPLAGLDAAGRIRIALKTPDDMELVKALLKEMLEQGVTSEELLARLDLLLIDAAIDGACPANVGQDGLCAYLLQEDGTYVLYRDGEIVESTENAQPLQYAQAETGAAIDAAVSASASVPGAAAAGAEVAAATAATGAALSVPAMAAIGLGAVGVAAAGGGGGGPAAASSSGGSPSNVPTNGNDILDFSGRTDDIVINALAGNDTITTGSGNDIVRPGEGVDTVNTGAGNDIVVVVGQTAAGQYAQSAIDNPGGSGINLSGVVTLADLNGRTLSEVQPGESIDGGAGTNRLVIYGTVDFTGVTLANITQFQVNSTLTISAQQLNALGLNLIFGDGDSVINIVNPTGDPVTVDLSGVSFSDFKTLNLGANITLIVDQADVADLLYLTGSGALRASDASGTLNLAGKYTTLAIQDKDGAPHAGHGGSVVSGDLLIASEAGETLTGGTGDDRLLGGDGNDILNGGDGNDILRGGKGVDEMHGGAGDDRFVIVGDLSGGGKIDSAADTDVLGFPLTTLNGKTFGEDVGGGVIRGGEGNDTLYVFGTADLSDWDIEGIENIEIRSDVKFTKAFFDKNVVKTINGDGSSTLRFVSDTPITLDLAALDAFKLSGIGSIELGSNVTLEVTSLDQLGGARILTGSGKIEAKSGNLDLSGYTKTTGLKVKNADGSDTTGGEVLENAISRGKDGVYRGTNGDDYMKGSAVKDTFISGNGNDVMLGDAGDDTYIIDGTGKKTILDTAGMDTLDLSRLTTGANVDLSNGGTAGATTIELGSGAGRAPIDLMILQDLSGSFGDDVPTVIALLDSLFAGVRGIHSDSRFGASAFVDKPIEPFGAASSGDYVYKTWQTITNDTAAVKTAFNNMQVLYGMDGPESQLEAIYQVALRTIADDATATTTGDEIGYRPGSMRVVVLTTDANYHVAGHHASAGPNDGDTILDGTPPGTGEDYPTVAAVKEALAKANIYPIFAVTSGNNATYESLVTQLGRGDVLPLSSNSSNLISSIQTGLTNYKQDFIENLIGTDLKDELTGNSLNNRIEGGKGDDVLKGMGGDDTLIGSEGQDTASYSGISDQYDISDMGSWYSVSDRISGRDGIDRLYGIESVQFSDKKVSLSEGALNPLKIDFSGKGMSIWGLTDIDETFDFLKIDALKLINGGKPISYDPEKKDWSVLKFDSNLTLNDLTVGLPLAVKVSLGAYDVNYVVESNLEFPDSIASGSMISIVTKAPVVAEKSSYFAVTPPEASISLGAELTADLTGSLLDFYVKLPGLDPLSKVKSFGKISEKATLAEFTLGGADVAGRETKISDSLAEKWMTPKTGEDLTDAKELFGAKNKGELIDKASGFLSGEDDLTLIQFPPTAVTKKTHLDPFFTVSTKLGAEGSASDDWVVDSTDGLLSVASSISLADLTATLSVDDIFPATNKLLDGDWKFFEYKSDDGVSRQIFKVDYTILGIDLEATIKPVINVEFNPSDVLMTLASSDGKFTQTKVIGESFDIDSKLFSGSSVDFITSYQLIGNVHSKFGFEVDLGFDLKALGIDVSYDTTDNPWKLVPDDLTGEFSTESLFKDDFLVETLHLPDTFRDADHDPEKFLFDWEETFSLTDLLSDIADIDTYFDSLSADVPFAIVGIGDTYHIELV